MGLNVSAVSHVASFVHYRYNRLVCSVGQFGMAIHQAKVRHEGQSSFSMEAEIELRSGKDWCRRVDDVVVFLDGC